MLAADLLLIVSAASVPVLQQKYFLALGGGSVNLYAMFILGEIVFAVCAFMYLTGSFVTAIKEKNSKWAYREENLFFLGQILTKLKTTTKTMTLICLTLMVSIGLFLSIPALAGWASGYLEERAVFDIRIASLYNQTESIKELPDTGYEFVTDFLKKEGIAVEDDCTMTLYLPRKELFYSRMKSDFRCLPYPFPIIIICAGWSDLIPSAWRRGPLPRSGVPRCRKRIWKPSLMTIRLRKRMPAC